MNDLTIIVLLTASIAGRTGVVDAAEPPVLLVPASKVTLHLAAPLSETVKLEPADAWQLIEVGKPDVAIPAQLVPAIAADGAAAADAMRLVADVPPREGTDNPRRFRLVPAKTAAGGTPVGFQFTDVDDKSLKLAEGEKPVLVYNHGLITCDRVPKSDHRRSRACYVHPVWGLSGEVITDDFSRDHYHHHGIYWTWPHVGIGEKHYNLWSGNDIKDKFIRWICRETGPAAAVLAVENGWFVGDKKVMVERVWLRAYKASEDSRSLDIEFTWIPLDRPITLWGRSGKSYGGLTMRFRPSSRNETTIIVPNGRTTDDLKIARLAWVDFTSKFGEAPSGAAVMVHPDHPDYPPTWLTRHYGPLCCGWPGVKPKTFEPGKPIRLSYRIWIHKTAVEPDVLKQAYEGYVTAAKASWE